MWFLAIKKLGFVPRKKWRLSIGAHLEVPAPKPQDFFHVHIDGQWEVPVTVILMKVLAGGRDRLVWVVGCTRDALLSGQRGGCRASPA